MNTTIDGIDYGPLAQLLGSWSGQKGLDNAPDNKANPDISAFSDELTFSVAGRAENAEEQENGLIFHDQIGHWIYEHSTGLIMHSLTIPRAVCLLAGGSVTQNNDEYVFDVNSKAGSETFGIVQSPFMIEKAKTKAFHMKMVVKGNILSYEETTSLFIYDKDFEHVDKSSLMRISYDLD